MNFESIEPISIPVTIAGKNYVLKEATADVACKYRNIILKSTKLNVDGRVTSMEGLADAEPFLVSLCLFEVDGDKLKPVPITTIRSWPNRIQKALFAEAKNISELDEKETEAILQKRIKDSQEKLEGLRSGALEEASKNGLLATTGTSA